jgi:hypothetical protein
VFYWVSICRAVGYGLCATKCACADFLAGLARPVVTVLSVDPKRTKKIYYHERAAQGLASIARPTFLDQAYYGRRSGKNARIRPLLPPFTLETAIQKTLHIVQTAPLISISSSVTSLKKNWIFPIPSRAQPSRECFRPGKIGLGGTAHLHRLAWASVVARADLRSTNSSPATLPS